MEAATLRSRHYIWDSNLVSTWALNMVRSTHSSIYYHSQHAGKHWGDLVSSGCNRISTLKILSLHINPPLDMFIDDEVEYHIEDHDVPKFVKFSDRVISCFKVERPSHVSLHGFKTTDTLPDFFHQASSLENLALLSIGAGTRDTWQATLESMRQLTALTSLTLDRITSTMLNDGPATLSNDWEVVFGPSSVHRHVWKYDRACSDLNDCVHASKLGQ
jgi:hypothetical protein